jgi:hypothetical protein
MGVLSAPSKANTNTKNSFVGILLTENVNNFKRMMICNMGKIWKDEVITFFTAQASLPSLGMHMIPNGMLKSKSMIVIARNKRRKEEN